MIWIILALGLAAVIVEAICDRKGEYKRGKIRDAIGLTIAASLICLIAYWLGDVPPLNTLVLLLGIRLLVFDYLVSYLLIKNKVIVGHWFTYSGKTAKWDGLISKINPWVRLALRALLFCLALWWFLSRYLDG